MSVHIGGFTTIRIWELSKDFVLFLCEKTKCTFSCLVMSKLVCLVSYMNIQYQGMFQRQDKAIFPRNMIHLTAFFVLSSKVDTLCVIEYFIITYLDFMFYTF